MFLKHVRKKNRLPPQSYRGFRSHLITLCTRHRQRRFTSSAIVNAVLTALSQQSERYCFAVHAYCFMPDHCPLLLLSTTADSDLIAFVRGFKANAAVALRRNGFHDFWQKGFHDRILRTSEEVSAATAYIFENPLRAGLTGTVHNWPFSGSFLFEWKEFAGPGIGPSGVAELDGVVDIKAGGLKPPLQRRIL